MNDLIYLFFFLFKDCSHISQSSLKLILQQGMTLNSCLSATPKMRELQVWAIMPSSGLRFFHRLCEMMGLWKVACLEGGDHRGHVLGLTLSLAPCSSSACPLEPSCHNELSH